MSKAYFAHLICLAYIFSVFCVSAPSLVYANDFVVSKIKIDEADKGSASAKKKGLLKAERQAFSSLMHRLIPNASVSAIDSITNSQISNSIISFYIENEKLTAHRYSATVNYTFDPNIVKSLISNVPKQRTEKILIIPVFYGIDGEVKIWETDWWYSWSKLASNFTIPLGNINDILAITLEDITSKNIDNLKKITQIYNAEEILIIEGHEEENKIEVIINRPFFTQVKKIVFVHSLHSGTEELFTKVVRNTLDKIGEAFYSPNISIVNNSAKHYLVAVTNLEKWPFIRDVILKQYSHIIQYISTYSILVDVHWNDTLSSLMSGLAKYQIDINLQGNMILLS